MAWNPFKRFSRNEKKDVGMQSHYGSSWIPLGGDEGWSERRYETLSRECYLMNSIGFRCMKLIAQTAASIDIHLVKQPDPAKPQTERVYNHPALDIIKRPSPLTPQMSFFEQVYSYIRLAGNAYIRAISVNGEPRELWCLRPDRVRVFPSRSGLPSRYEYRHEMFDQFITFNVHPVTGDSEVLHFREFHPLDDCYGMSRGQPAQLGIDRYNAASVHNKALLKNGARPSGALVFKPIKSPDGDLISAPKEVLKAAEDVLMMKHQGPGNSGKPMVLGGDVDWEAFGITPRDMDFNENMKNSALDICTAWGVPSILVLTENATYNNIKEAKLELYEEVVIPLVKHVLNELNHWLLPKIDKDPTLMFTADLDSVIALEPRRQVRRKSIADLLSQGVINIREARQELGYGVEDDSAIAAAVDGDILRGLVEAAQVVGAEPLRRYMIATGLVEEGVPLTTLLGQALDLDIDDGTGDPSGD